MDAQQIEELFELQNVMAVNVDQDSPEFVSLPTRNCLRHCSIGSTAGTSTL
jgi:hypothetical protein